MYCYQSPVENSIAYFEKGQVLCENLDIARLKTAEWFIEGLTLCISKTSTVAHPPNVPTSVFNSKSLQGLCAPTYPNEVSQLPI